jgi:hypothetical protein
MRVTSLLLRYCRGNKNARAPQNIRAVPFKPILPMNLRDRGECRNFHTFILAYNLLLAVSGKVDAIDTVPCLHELSILFAAMKENEFDEKLCKKEIEAIKKAHDLAETQKKDDKARNSGLVVSTGRKLTSLQLNRYLKRFPLKVTK